MDSTPCDVSVKLETIMRRLDSDQWIGVDWGVVSGNENENTI